MLRVNIVSTVEGQSINNLEVSSDSTVDNLRSVVARHLGVADSPAVLRLLHGGRLLQNGRTLGSYSIHDGGSIHVVARHGAAPAAAGAGPSASANAAGGANPWGNAAAPPNFDLESVLRSLPGIAGDAARQQQFSNNAASLGMGIAAQVLSGLFGGGGLNGVVPPQSQAAYTGAGATPTPTPTPFPFPTGLFQERQPGPQAASEARTSEPIPPPPPFEITLPTPAPGTVPLTGPFLMEHMLSEVRAHHVNINGVAMALLMDNALALQPLRPHFAAAWRTYALQQRAVVFPSSAEFAHRRIISLAGSEAERVYATVLSQVETQNFLRARGGVNSTSALITLHGEMRKYLKSLYLRLIRLIKVPETSMSNPQWGQTLLSLIVYHVGLFVDRAPRWFPRGGADAAVQFISDAVLEVFRSVQEGDAATAAVMLPTVMPQLLHKWHNMYVNTMRRGDDDYECFWNYPTSGDIAVEDPDDLDDALGGERAKPTPAAAAATASPSGLSPPAESKDDELKRAAAEWARVAGVQDSFAKQLEEAVGLSLAGGGGGASALAPVPSESEQSRGGRCEDDAGEEGPAASSLWSEMSRSRRK